jgi:GT2 family glycosyltransferase/glycosyltransferase involved in cell wall biosynthesis
MPPDKKASLIILTYNNLDYTRQCLDSIYAHTRHPDFEVILVDNASQDETPEFLRKFAQKHANVHLILNQTNQGFSRGNNQGAEAAVGEVLVFLNNDIVVTEGWLSGLLRHLEDPQVGMVGPVTNASGNQSRIAVDYETLDDMPPFAASYTSAHRGQASEIPMLPFQCVAIPRAVFEEVGPLDERFGVGMFEDDDYALRLKQHGYKILCAEDVFVHHWGSASFGRIDFDAYWDLFRKNLHKFEAKWDRKWMPHQQRLEFVPEQLRQAIEAQLFFTQAIHDQKIELERLQDELVDVQPAKAELQAIYESNGWRFLQALLRVRRALIPEGSQRERVLRAGIQTLRQMNSQNLRAVLRETAELFRRDRLARRAVQPSFYPLELAAVDDAALQAHFPWPLVSVILPVYNHADMLEHAAHSVLYGTYSNLELIILDDGSSDEIEPVLQRLSINPRVRIYQQPNQKLPRALSHAHRFARGQFITWTSSDNLLAPNALETLVKRLIEHPEAVMVYADVAVIDEQGKQLKHSNYRPQNQDPQHPEIMRLHRQAEPLGFEVDNYINACFLYRRQAAQALEGRYADDLRGLEDYDFWLRLQKSGRIQHAGNREPLYYYRVHERSMSHELLSEQRDGHLKRGQRFIEYEAQRRAYSQRRWSLGIDSLLPTEQRKALLESAGWSAVDVLDRTSSWEEERKHLRFVAPGNEPPEPIYVHMTDEEYQLVWRSPWDQAPRELHLWPGLWVNPLAYKARDYHKNPWEFPQAGQRPIFGCHLSLAHSPFDVQATRRMIESNPWAYFIFADIPGERDAQLGKRLVADLENAAYVENREYWTSYSLYASFDYLWIPPLAAPVKDSLYRRTLALAYAIARPLLFPQGTQTIAAPYQYCYDPLESGLDFVRALDPEDIDHTSLDRYLNGWQPPARLEQLLKYADAVTQEMATERPDFGIQTPAEQMPTRWTPATPGKGETLKCALMVKTLDKGGLESVVAGLAQRLPEHDLETFVLCTQSGGMIADQLKAAGVQVYVANGRPESIHRILSKEKPHLVSSQWADLSGLQAATGLGIPVVETIHNMYVWLDAHGWKQEQQRSLHFTRAAAVSQLVKKYYLNHNSGMHPDWVAVIPNSADPQRLPPVDYRKARQALGIPEEEFIFLSLASYDGRKNQLGMLSAFEQVAQDHPEARLVCAGNIADANYYETLQDYRAALKSGNRIQFHPFRQDTNLLLSAANVFVMDSFYEGWSLSATEALMTGIPLIHSNCGSALELVGKQGQRGRIVSNPGNNPLSLTWPQTRKMIAEKHQRNTAELVHAMQIMLSERDVWLDKRAEIRTYALEHFTIQNTLEGYVRLFASVLNQQGARSISQEEYL